MKLLLQRDPYGPKGTTGELSIDGGPRFCDTLERPRNDEPFPCIPAGTFPVVLHSSPHFGRLMPLLQNVPDRSDIEMHWGNYVTDSEGCILVGDTRGVLGDGEPFILNTREAFDRLFAAIEAAAEQGDLTIEIREAPPASS